MDPKSSQRDSSFLSPKLDFQHHSNTPQYLCFDVQYLELRNSRINQSGFEITLYSLIRGEKASQPPKLWGFTDCDQMRI